MSANVVPLKGAKRPRKSPVSGTVPNRKANDALRTRSHLTENEVGKKRVYVGVMEGADEDADAETIAQWGAKLTFDEAKGFYPELNAEEYNH